MFAAVPPESGGTPSIGESLRPGWALTNTCSGGLDGMVSTAQGPQPAEGPSGDVLVSPSGHEHTSRSRAGSTALLERQLGLVSRSADHEAHACLGRWQ